MAKSAFKENDPSFSQTGPFHDVQGSAKPKSVNALRVNEINTQRHAAGVRGGTVSGQGPALESA